MDDQPIPPKPDGTGPEELQPLAIVSEPTLETPQPLHEAESLVQRVGRSALNLVARSGVMLLLSVITTLAIVRLLDPAGYGAYGSATATSALLGAAADLGFSMMLSRDMGNRPERHRSLLRAAYEVALVWSGFLALVMIGFAFTAPVTSPRGGALLVLAPAMLFNGLNPARVIFIVRFETRRLVIVDTIVGIAQTLACITAAAVGLGPVGVAAVVAATGIIDNLVVAVLAERMLPSSSDRFSRRTLVRRSAPLGALTIMTKVYLTIDLVLLGWYVQGTRLGDYAVASKLLTVIAGFAGVAMTGALPGLAQTALDRDGRDPLIERIWHWLVVLAVPMFAGLALFAPLVVKVALGSRYHGAIILIRILSLAGAVTVLSNLVGNVLVALRKTRQLFMTSTIAIVTNIVANLLLIPRYGVYAAAWTTVATEVAVALCSMALLRHELPWPRLVQVSARPIAAIVLASAVAVPFLRSQWQALAIGTAAYLCGVSLLRAWPPEFALARRRR